MLFTASDFGRTLTSNGAGSDHAWGGNAFMLGGPVNGGKIYGDYPILATGGPLDPGRGRLLPTTSVDEYTAELATWFGVPQSELSTILPDGTGGAALADESPDFLWGPAGEYVVFREGPGGLRDGNHLWSARADGTGKRKIAKQLGVGVSTVTRILAEAI